MCFTRRRPISAEICRKQSSLLVVDGVFILYLYLVTESNSAGHGTNSNKEHYDKEE